jgi:hypothetical protein
VSSYGIRLNNSTLNLNNGYITAKGAGNVAGIYAFESNVFFNTSDGLKISASSASLESNFTTAGIFLSDSNLDFSKANSSSTLSINAVNTNGKSYGIYGKKSTITAEENSKNILFGGSITPNNQIVLQKPSLLLAKRAFYFKHLLATTAAKFLLLNYFADQA